MYFVSILSNLVSPFLLDSDFLSLDHPQAGGRVKAIYSDLLSLDHQVTSWLYLTTPNENAVIAGIASYVAALPVKDLYFVYCNFDNRYSSMLLGTYSF